MDLYKKTWLFPKHRKKKVDNLSTDGVFKKNSIKMYSIPSHKSFCAKQIQNLNFCYSTVAHVPHFLEKFCWFAISNIPQRPFQLVLVILTPRGVFRRGFSSHLQKEGLPKRKYMFQPSIFSENVSFREGIIDVKNTPKKKMYTLPNILCRFDPF